MILNDYLMTDIFPMLKHNDFIKSTLAQVCTNSAKCCLELDKNAEAIVFYRSSLKYENENPYTYYNLCEVYGKTNDLTKMLALLEEGHGVFTQKENGAMIEDFDKRITLCKNLMKKEKPYKIEDLKDTY